MDGIAMYHIDVVNIKTGRRVRCTSYPMVEKECRVMINKMTSYSWRSIELVAVVA